MRRIAAIIILIVLPGCRETRPRWTIELKIGAETKIEPDGKATIAVTLKRWHRENE